VTGVAWFDWLAAGAFGLLAVVSLGRLARRRSAGERADAAAHGVMAAGMAAMALPTGNPVPAGAWVAVFAVVAAGAAGSLVRSPRRRPPPPIRGPGPPPAGAGARRLPLTAAAHHVAASVLMIVLLTTGHSAHPVPAPEVVVDTTTSGAGSPLDHHHDEHHHHHAGEPVSAAVAAPTPLVTAAGLGFLAYAAWLAVGLVRPRNGAARCACAGGLTRGDAACGVAMAVGMGLMALAMA
jgi:hypothetical protein